MCAVINHSQQNLPKVTTEQKVVLPKINTSPDANLLSSAGKLFENIKNTLTTVAATSPINGNAYAPQKFRHTDPTTGETNIKFAFVDKNGAVREYV